MLSSQTKTVSLLVACSSSFSAATPSRACLRLFCSAVMPKPLAIAGPSGVGKSTLIKRLMSEYPDQYGFSVSHTTRKPRAGEVDGVNYHFVARERMEQDIADGKFIETNEFAGNLYGTSFAAVKAVQSAGKTCILDIDLNGLLELSLLLLLTKTTFKALKV